LIKKYSELCELCGHEKKSKNHQNCKFCLNEIKYLQLLNFAKRDFFLTTCASAVNLFFQFGAALPR